MSSVRSSRAGLPVIALGLAALGGLVLATWRLGTPSSINDEVAYRSAVTALLRGDWTLNNQHPPLAKELIALSRIAGEHLGLSELLADRALGVVCFVLTGFVLAALARGVSAGRSGAWAGVGAGALWWWLPLAPGVLVDHVDRYALLEGPVLLFTALAAWTAQRLVARVGASAGRGTVASRGTATGTGLGRWRGGSGTGGSLGGWLLLGLWVGAATASKLTGVLAAPLALVPLGAALRPARGTDAGGTDARGTSRRRMRALSGAVLAGVVALGVFALSYVPMGHHAPAALRTAITYQLHHADEGHVQTVAGRNYAFPPFWTPLWFQEQYLGVAALLALWLAALGGVIVAVRRASGLVPVAGLVVTAVAVAAMSIKLPQYHDVVVLFLDVLAGVALSALGRVALGRVALGRVALGRVALGRSSVGRATGVRTSRRGRPPQRRAGLTGGAASAGLAGLVFVLLLAPLAVRAARGADAVAHLRPGDYRVAAQVLRAHGITGPVVVWGDGAGLAEQDPHLVVTPTMPADCHPVALVTDATNVHRIPGVDLAAWRHDCGAGYQRVAIDRVTVYLRR